MVSFGFIFNTERAYLVLLGSTMGNWVVGPACFLNCAILDCINSVAPALLVVNMAVHSLGVPPQTLLLVGACWRRCCAADATLLNIPRVILVHVASKEHTACCDALSLSLTYIVSA
jgi:hypothetical protein